jgi:hypothetical protein
MCTVTFLPIGENEFILTSSRDVPLSRKKALAPKKYIEDSVELTYPKDSDAGGTWIGTSSKNRLICLLNGGYVNHNPEKNYRASRGLIVKELLKSDNIKEILSTLDLNKIEPFTLAIVDWNDGLDLYDFVWTGKKKHLISIPKTPHIWSSSTLYSDTVKKKRENWFADWQKGKTKFESKAIINFHKTAGDGNLKNNVLMKREGGGTVSISSVKKVSDTVDFYYEPIG